MMPDEQKLPLWALIGLGASQNIGYGTLYYAFSILVPEIARDIGRSEQWVFGAFSIALLAGSLAAPLSGTLADRIGAGRLMAAGSLLAAACLVMMSRVVGAADLCRFAGVDRSGFRCGSLRDGFHRHRAGGRKEGPNLDRSPDTDGRVRVVDVLAPDFLDARIPVVA
ncbi:hypothetical protein LZK73_15155 [Neorhizobium galegae]|nr:hypothetical protein LZK73_15155 [Neorhizobium galegae]